MGNRFAERGVGSEESAIRRPSCAVVEGIDEAPVGSRIEERQARFIQHAEVVTLPNFVLPHCVVRRKNRDSIVRTSAGKTIRTVYRKGALVVMHHRIEVIVSIAC